MPKSQLFVTVVTVVTEQFCRYNCYNCYKPLGLRDSRTRFHVFSQKTYSIIPWEVEKNKLLWGFTICFLSKTMELSSQTVEANIELVTVVTL